MPDTRVPVWKKVVAAILDFFFAFFVIGIAVASLTGETTEGGFSLNGASALVAFALIGLYFWGGSRLGGTLFQRVLRTRG